MLAANKGYMNGLEVERILSLVDETTASSREDIVRYIEANREQILRELESSGESEIHVPGGDTIVLRKAA